MTNHANRGDRAPVGRIPRSRSIVSLCDRTTTMLKPWAMDGYRCVAVDLAHGLHERHRPDGIVTVGCDVRGYNLPADAGLVLMSPPCTHLAGSGARWWRSKGLSTLIGALQLVEACRALADDCGLPYLLENPVGLLGSWWRPCDWSFHPAEYAGYLGDPEPEAYTKLTCIWTGGGIAKPPTRPVEPALGSKMHKLPPSPDRADIRSAAPEGFARAVHTMLRDE